MDEKKRLDAIQALERQINGLPIGYISKKNINGKARYYHQWTEAGKKRSRYLRDGELEPLQKQIEERRSLQAELKKLQAEMPKQSQPKLDFETSVIISAMAGRCGPVKQHLTTRTPTPRTPPSGMTSLHGAISTRRSAGTSSTPWPAMRPAGIFAICTPYTRPGN